MGKTPAKGKHETLARKLERKILEGQFGWSGGLPAAPELAEKNHMSVNTVKSALALLEGKGLIEKRGIGYYVNKVPITMTEYVPTGNLRTPNSGFCRNVGSLKRTALPPHLAERFSGASEAVYRMQVSGEVRGSVERPLQITHKYYLIPLSDEQVQHMEQDAAYDPMRHESRFQVTLMAFNENAARLATKGEEGLLSLQEGSPVQTVLETIQDKSNGLLLIQEVVLHPSQTLAYKYSFDNRSK